MKNKLKYYNANFCYYANSQKFKFLFVLMIIISLYCSSALTYVDGSYLNYIPAIFSIFNNKVFIIFMLFICLMTTINTYIHFNSSNYYIIRLKSKKEYLRELINNTIFNNLVTLIIQVIMILIGLNVFCSSNLGISVMENYNILNIIYLLFFLIRSFMILLFVSVINCILFNIIHKNVIFVINALYYASIVCSAYILNIDNLAIQNMKWQLLDYLTLQSYNSFFSEVYYSVFYITILITIIHILFRYAVINIKQVGE